MEGIESKLSYKTTTPSTRSFYQVDTVKEKITNLRHSMEEVRVRAHMSANNGMCSPYVTVKLVPGPAGAVTASKVRTGSRSRTLFPIFDETFDLILPEGVCRSQVYLLLSVKDLGPLGDRILLGEAVLPVDQIKRCVLPANVHYSLVNAPH